ncbi:phage tail protein [Klebsiella pneumoniae]|uniref:phage tail protein n=1 Tax=Klebsiella pneumoniae TaxID=573 RepID=UPI000DEBF247|nr:phage tail protein [Klebsiella pneumoniae]RCG40371.1 phage tail protein [Klebsiella pneumoniae]RCG41189.1 phage tail protein [Klebsiella pneumoniae]RCG49106.1 phage tail protein [Klebsiella pneumoniae]RCG56569.1 phage tail protein [Klebsiella pneumoniae]RCG58770.1 phage tail protein [Klebsiella pneumoniae]
MATKYYAVLTNVGAAKLANATALGAQVEITQMAVGDGNGVLPTPNPAQTALVHELRRAPLNSLSIDPNNANQIIAEQVIPEDVGGWWIREIGLFDKDGDMIAVANCAETYKPQLQEGSGRVQVVRMILIVSSTAAVTLKIDPSVVLATRQYVDDQIIQVKSYVDQKMAAHVAAADPHKQYAPKESPALTGRPTAPTAEGKDSSTQIANTAFVQAAIAALVGSSPEALDTLNELAAALGNDPNFATTVTNSLAGKMDKSANGSDIENVSVFLQNLGLGEMPIIAKYGSPMIGELVHWPMQQMPQEIWTDMRMEFIPYMAQSFDGSKYPLLAQLHPSLRLPADMRGEFVRGWDNGRGINTGQQLMSWSADLFKSHNHTPTNGSFFTFVATGGGQLVNGSNNPNVAIVPTTNSVGGAETRPRSVAWNFIVRAK